jgi:hypothetical protein
VISEIVRSLVGRADGHGDATAAPLVRSADERQRFLEYARGGRVDGAPLMFVHGPDPLPDMRLRQPDVVGHDTNWLAASPGADEQPAPGPVPKRAESGTESGCVETTLGVRTAGCQGFVDAHPSQPTW